MEIQHAIGRKRFPRPHQNLRDVGAFATAKATVSAHTQETLTSRASAVLTGSGCSQSHGDPIVGHCAGLPEDGMTPRESDGLALLLKQPQNRFAIIPQNFMSNTQSLHCRHQVTVATPSSPLKHHSGSAIPGPAQPANASARRSRAAESAATSFILPATEASTDLAHTGMRDKLSSASAASTSLTP